MSTKDLILCQVYKSGPHEQTYLFVDRDKGLDDVPDELRAQFKNPIRVTEFKLTPDRKMARANAANVMESIRAKGFYIQLPPPKDPHLAAMTEMAAKNDKLPI